MRCLGTTCIFIQKSDNCIIKIVTSSIKFLLFSRCCANWFTFVIYQTLNMCSDWSVCLLTFERFLDNISETQLHPEFYKHLKSNLSLQNTFYLMRHEFQRDVALLML